MIRYIRTDGQVVIACAEGKIVVVDKFKETRVEVTTEQAMKIFVGHKWILDMESNYKKGEEKC